VCEGACNPSLHTLDAEVAEARKRESSFYLRRVYALDTGLTEKLRQLAHTLHEPVAETRWRCTCCGHIRRFGLVKEPRRREGPSAFSQA
jgi:hypothetical protein